MIWDSLYDKDKDIHVVVGHDAPDLRERLVFITDNNRFIVAKDYFDDGNTDVRLIFKPLFKASSTAGNQHTGHGISVNKTSGKVSLTNPLPSPASRKHNFIIEIEARSQPGDVLIDKRIKRIHVHQSVDQVWLTPSTLKVRPFTTTRPENTKYRFNLRAQFDDGIVGDITDLPEIVWTPTANVDRDSGEIILKAGDNTSDTTPITARLPAGMGGASATANIEVAAAWDSANTVDASVVVGGGWPGTLDPDKVANVLIIGDGFTPPARQRFLRYVNSLVHYIKKNPVNRPFDVLSTSMNFWTAFFPSTINGVSMNTEVYPVGTGADMKARAVDPPEDIPPESASGSWDMSHLIYHAGLPAPVHETKSVAEIRTIWSNQIDSPPTEDNVDDDMVERWQRRAKRSLIEMVDTELGITIGETTSSAGDYRDINLNEFRIDRDDMDVLFRSLRDPRNIPINHLWAKTTPGCDPDTDPNCLPKDYDMVCILVAGKGRAANNEGYYFLDIMDDVKIKNAAGRNAFEFNIAPDDIPDETDNEHARVFVHELIHSFHIGDAYGEAIGPPVSRFSLDAIEESSNLTLEDNAKSGGRIDGDQIKWNWHRIRKAGVVDQAITAEAGGKFKISMRTGDGFRFALGDTVHLRFRDFKQPLPKHPKISPPLQVVEPAPDSVTVYVKPVAGSTFSYPDPTRLIDPANFIAEFKPGSILYMPTRAPNSVYNANTYPYAELVAKNIKDFMTSHDTPLTEYPSEFDDNDVQNPRIDGVSLPDCFSRKRPRIIGLYSGGHGFHKGVFHPAGSCLMRDQDTDGQEICAVCRYILVDMIDPNEHWWIDRDLDSYYPQE